MYVRMRIIKWGDLEVGSFGHILVKMDADSIGFLEVFNTKEDLLKAYPDETLYAKLQAINEIS